VRGRDVALRRVAVNHLSISEAKRDAPSLEERIAGEPWTPLILRDLFVGIRRFDDLHRDLGISRKVLTQRLNHLLDHGIIERDPYTNKPVRYDYLLTDKGWELCDILLAITAWGDRWTAGSDGPPSFSTTPPAGTGPTRSSHAPPATSLSTQETFTPPPVPGHHRWPSHPPKQLSSLGNDGTRTRDLRRDGPGSVSPRLDEPNRSRFRTEP